MKQSIPENVQKRIAATGQQVIEGLTGVYQQARSEEGASLRVIEESIRAVVQDAGLGGMEVVVGQFDRERRKGAQPCPRCGREYQWTRYEERQCISTMGEFTIERAYYHCPPCHAGWCPLDEQLQLGRSELSPSAEQIASYAGAFMPFTIAADFLDSSGLLTVSPDTVNNTTVRVGEVLEQQQMTEVEVVWSGEVAYPVYEGSEPPETLYLSADGVRYLTTDGSGRELKVAVVYETQMGNTAQGLPDPRTVRPSYVVSSQPPEEFSKVVDLLAQRRGVQQAQRTAVLQDGGVWLWDHIAPLAGPQRVEIIDFYHAAGYITDAVEALFPPEQRAFWNHVLLDHLQNADAGAERVADVLRCLTTPSSTPLLAVQEALDYLQRYGSRMHYHQYQLAGFQIGSGTVESAAKQVVSDRLKQAGMRWNPLHAEAVAQVRAAILSRCWQGFWQTYRPRPRTYQRKGRLSDAV